MASINRPTHLANTAPQITQSGSGKRPDTTKTQAAPYLPILKLAQTRSVSREDIPIVIEAGMTVGLDPWGWMVPCPGYTSAATITYGALDVAFGYVPHIDSIDPATGLAATTSPTYVTSAGASTETLGLIIPIGIAEFDIPINRAGYSDAYINFQKSKLSIYTVHDAFEVPLTLSAQATLQNGDDLTVNPVSTISAANKANVGKLIKYVAATHTEPFKVGRVVQIKRLDQDEALIHRAHAPGMAFNYRTSAVSGDADYQKKIYPDHLVSVASVARTIGYTNNTTTLTGTWSIKFIYNTN